FPREKIEAIFAHPQTRGQCRNWLQRNFANADIIETPSNAISAERAKGPTYRTLVQKQAVGAAGIARAPSQRKPTRGTTSQLAAERYGLPVLEQDIQDNAANATRFLVLGRQCSPPTGHDRTSLMISVTDKVGALHEALASFRRAKINLTKIESRPSKRKAW